MLESLSESYPKRFIPENAIVGWTQGHTCRSVAGEIIGREMRGIVIKDSGVLEVRTEFYVKVTGNAGPLNMVPNSRLNLEGWTPYEYVIAQDLSLDRAMNMQYSPPSQESFQLTADNVHLLQMVA